MLLEYILLISFFACCLILDARRIMVREYTIVYMITYKYLFADAISFRGTVLICYHVLCAIPM